MPHGGTPAAAGTWEEPFPAGLTDYMVGISTLEGHAWLGGGGSPLAGLHMSADLVLHDLSLKHGTKCCLGRLMHHPNRRC